MSDEEASAFVQEMLDSVQLRRFHLHLDQCEKCRQLVATRARALMLDPVSGTNRTSWNTTFQRNDVISQRYRIIRLAARGGMGEIYEAFDLELQERVALKTVTSTGCSNENAVRALKAEVQLARRIGHPNVCRIYDFGTHCIDPTSSPIHFLVMEFVDGQNLGQRLRETGALTVELTTSVVKQLLQGLRAAHKAGILHRDLKSDNVMLRVETDGRLTPVILDFGLARVLNEAGRTATTQSQGMVGTLGYMSPEQVEGHNLSAASDLYSLGVMWFEMLTGRLPFVADSAAAVALARLHQEPVAPSTLNSEVPPWQDAIVLRCLTRHRQERFSSAEQVLEAIEHAAPSSRRSRRRLATRLEALALMFATVSTLAIISVVSWRHPAQPQSQANVLLVLPEKHLQRQILARLGPLLDVAKPAPLTPDAAISPGQREAPAPPGTSQPPMDGTAAPPNEPNAAKQATTVKPDGSSSVAEQLDWLPP
ncbi:MAG TPA: serine/threonine-protein kinase [Polyangiaceae bacterium]|nr:serine/threonine-protein kinase [Polyangiaceae bacterium]